MCKPRWFGLLTIGLVLAANPLLALSPDKAMTQYTRTTWTQGEGLPGDTVRRIAQTSDGFLWIGTDEGLARFDGSDFTVFNHASGDLPGDVVTGLVAAHDGSLWIGTREGLAHYTHHKFVSWGAKQGLPQPEVISMYEDRDSTLWIAFSDRVCIIRNDSLQVIPEEKLAGLKFPRAFFQDGNGTFWIAGAGLIRQQGSEFVPVLSSAQMHGLLTSTFAEDNAGTLWLGTNHGILARHSDGEVRLYDQLNQLPNPLVHSLLIDKDGVLWAGTNGGLVRFEKDRFVPQNIGPSPRRVVVGALLEDREGDLWVGSGVGLSRFRDDRFTSYCEVEGWPDDGPLTTVQDRLGDLWIGYREAGLMQASVNKLGAQPKKLFTVRDGLVGNEITAIREARNGDLLIATRSGLSRMHDGHFQNTSIPDPLSRPQISDVLEDSSGRTLFATPRGVLTQEGHDWLTLVPGGSTNDNPILLGEGSEGEVWVATYGAGIWKITPGNVEHFTAAPGGLGSNRIRALFPDERGVLWIGTFGGGLIRFDGKRFSSFTAREGMPSNNVTHITLDHAGDLWISTTRGIARTSRADLDAMAKGDLKTLRVLTYGLEDGLRSLQTGPSVPGAPGGTLTRDGRVWFTTAQSLAVTDPSAADPQEVLLGTNMVRVSVGDTTLDPDNLPRLAAGSGPIQLKFTGLHLRGPQQVRYEYRLDGLDSQWSAPTNQRLVAYHGLQHGNYKFRVRALLGNQRYPEASYAFVVLPRFYETSWFVWVCGLAVVCAGYCAYQWRQRQIHSRFALIVGERTRLAREIHDTLAQGFFGISSQLDALSLKLDDPESVRRELNIARRMARHSLHEARRSVMDLRSAAADDRTLSEALASSARQWTEGSPIEVKLKLDRTDGLQTEVEQNILRIAQEAIANAMKHARPTSIGIELGIESRRLSLRVHDNGCGFDATNSLGDTQGHFGLIGMKERAQRIGALFNVSSRPGHGTTVEVTVPI